MNESDTSPDAARERLPAAADPASDPYLWLEDIHGEAALAWVRERNAKTQNLLQSRPEYAPMRARLLEVLNANDRIPALQRHGANFYNLWQDEQHPRGLWRRTSLEEYRRPAPAWDAVLDLDALGRDEHENWVWGGAVFLGPADARCLVLLSRGGADAKVVREFDSQALRFVDGGFVLPEAKTEVDWLDADTLIVGTDFGPGSMTDSGYARIARRWRRGTPLEAAETVFEGRPEDVWAGAWVDRTPGFERILLVRALDFYRQQRWLLDGEQRIPLELPEDARVSLMHSAGEAHDSLLLLLRSDWTPLGRTYPQGALLACELPAFLRGERRFNVLFEPTAARSLAGYTTTRRHVVLHVLEHVASRLEEWRRDGGRYVRREISAPHPGTLGVSALHDPMQADDALAENYLLSYTDFLTPDTLSLAHTGSDARVPLKARESQFDASGMRVEQRFANSRDGTRVPYFVIWPRGARADGANPTLLHGYGGFQVSIQPWYSGTFGSAWYERGGVFVVANIRGGGEYGPAWHRAAIGAHKQRSYDDFIAVAEDLIASRVTSPQHLGIEGGSNGGLLVGAVFTQRPELFNAVVCQVPLLDMKRYHRLLAGASWMAEFGDPDDAADWQTIARYSPYHQLRPETRYPQVLFTTSTRDDRVHPGHAPACTRGTHARWRPVCRRKGIRCSTTRTSKAAMVVPPTTRNVRT